MGKPTLPLLRQPLSRERQAVAVIAQLDDKLASMLDDGLSKLDLALPATAQEKLLAYVALLDKWNKVYNLTAVREPEKMISVHLLDSLAVLPYLGSTKKIIDVGTGGGLPGVPLAITRPEMSVTTLDCIQKKTTFIQQTIAELELKNASVVCERVEQYQPDTKFDVVISRAYSELAEFVNQAGHLCKDDGRLFAMKGVYPENEIAAVPSAWCVETVHELHVPLVEGKRHLLILKRTI